MNYASARRIIFEVLNVLESEEKIKEDSKNTILRLLDDMFYEPDHKILQHTICMLKEHSKGAFADNAFEPEEKNA